MSACWVKVMDMGAPNIPNLVKFELSGPTGRQDAPIKIWRERASESELTTVSLWLSYARKSTPIWQSAPWLVDESPKFQIRSHYQFLVPPVEIMCWSRWRLVRKSITVTYVQCCVPNLFLVKRYYYGSPRNPKFGMCLFCPFCKDAALLTICSWRHAVDL